MVECISKACSFAPMFCSSVSMLCCCQLAIATDVFAITETSSQLNARDSFWGHRNSFLGAQGLLFWRTLSFWMPRPFGHCSPYGWSDGNLFEKLVIFHLGNNHKSWQMSEICPGKGQGGNQGAQKRRKGSWGPWAPFPPFLRPGFRPGPFLEPLAVHHTGCFWPYS